jgi:hypothetical protein
MSDRFDIQREWDTAGERLVEEALDRVDEDEERLREREARLIKLGPGYYFDPLEKALLKRMGSQLGFVRHDRRHEREVKATKAEAEALGLREVSGGFFWDAKSKKLYRKNGEHFVLYTSDRRKLDEGAVDSEERRKPDDSAGK